MIQLKDLIDISSDFQQFEITFTEPTSTNIAGRLSDIKSKLSAVQYFSQVTSIIAFQNTIRIKVDDKL